MHVRRIITAGAVTAGLLCSGVATTTLGASAHGRHDPPPPKPAKVKVVLSGLTAAKSVNKGYRGNLIFGDQAADGTGALKEYITSGRHKGKVRTIAALPAAPSEVSTGPNGSYYILFGALEPEEGAAAARVKSRVVAPPVVPTRMLYKWSPRGGGILKPVADLGAYAVAHPDPADLEGIPGDSNPYGLAPLRDGSVLVADAGANAIRRVWPSGRIQTVAQLPTKVVSTSHVPPEFGVPPQLPAEAVPTSVAVGPDGAWYVGELTGFPFTPDVSRIWRIKPGAHDVSCNVANTRKAGCTLYASGFTAIIDLTFAPDRSLYVLEFGKDGILPIETGGPNTPPPPGALLRVKNGVRTELATGQLILPGGVVANPRGKGVYVTDFQLVPGAGRLLKIG